MKGKESFCVEGEEAERPFCSISSPIIPIMREVIACDIMSQDERWSVRDKVWGTRKPSRATSA
jgi:hypothetical protein